MATAGQNGLKKKILSLPDKCGVYIFKDAKDKCLYVGKANSLKKRVRSYFGRGLDLKTKALVSKVKDISYILSSSPAQAQILEASLVKVRQPPYNISLKDDKSFPFIKISAEKFPVVLAYREKYRKKQDKALYLGPYTDAGALRQALKAIRRIFPFRSCNSMPKKACLYQRLKLCPAPCIGNISQRQYAAIIKKIRMFFQSRYEELLRRLAGQMHKAAKEKNFEEAARIRDQAQALNAILSHKKDGSAGGGALEGLKERLKLKTLPLRIEAFDISNISGTNACGSMVSFLRGLPDKNNYRRFRIKTVTGIDDYAMLREVVARRYLRLKKEGLGLPGLVIIDGGKGHLLAAQEEIVNLGLDIPVVSIAKGKENIYIQGRGRPIRFSADTPALNLIRRIRDEAHRFAVKYHHLLRKKKILNR